MEILNWNSLKNEINTVQTVKVSFRKMRLTNLWEDKLDLLLISVNNKIVWHLSFFLTLVLFLFLSSSSRGSLEGKREQKSYKALLEDPMLRFSGLYQENCSDLYVTCQVFAEGKPLALPVRTSYKAFSTRWKWVPSCLCVCSCYMQ